MSQPADPSLHQADEPHLEYRTVDPVTVIGLGLGLLSPLALIGGVMVLFAGFAAVVNLVALARLKQDTGRTGRAAALAGLALSVVFGVLPITRWASARALLADQPREMADAWFEYLRQDKPELAYRLRFHPDYRPPADDSLWLFYRNDDEAKAELKGFVADPLVRRLLALGQQAQVRFYKTDAIVTDGSTAGVQYTYTVTYPDGDGKKTFFATLVLERRPIRNAKLSPWRVKGCFGGWDLNKSARKG
jgi:hypothetical protein